MKQCKILLCLAVLGFFITGCNVFPYVREPAVLTPSPTQTMNPSPTASLTIPTSVVTPDETESPTPVNPADRQVFFLQEGNPIYLPNFTHPDEGCDWLGVAGQVFNMDGIALLDYSVKAGTGIEDEPGDMSTVTGLATAYGHGGYELMISDSPVDTEDLYWIQVFDQDGQPLSEQIFFTTYSDCGKNLVLMNFVAQESSSVEKSLATPTLSAYP